MYVCTSSTRHLEACPYLVWRVSTGFFLLFFFQQSKAEFQTKLTHSCLRGIVQYLPKKEERFALLRFLPPSLGCAWTAFAKIPEAQNTQTNPYTTPYTRRQSEMCIMMNDDHGQTEMKAENSWSGPVTYSLIPATSFQIVNARDIITRLFHSSHTHNKLYFQLHLFLERWVIAYTKSEGRRISFSFGFWRKKIRPGGARYQALAWCA